MRNYLAMYPPLTIGDGLKRRDDNFLLLRIVAAIMVIYGHSFAISPSHGGRDIFLQMGWGTYSGDIAVDIFFVISGFMVSASYVRRGDLYHFLLARTLRIVPALAACLMISAFIIGPIFTSMSLSNYFGTDSTYLYVLQNLRFSSSLRWALPGVFTLNHYGDSVNGSLWTLPAEYRMYLFVALIGVLGCLNHKKIFFVLLGSVVLAGIIAPGFLPLHHMWVRLGAYFIIGISAFVYKDAIELRTDRIIVLIGATYMFRATALMPFIFAITLAYFCFWFGYRISLPQIEKYGDPSYGAYLWGWPLLQMFANVFPDSRSYVSFFVCSGIALLLGYISFHSLEKPMLQLKRVKIFN